MNILCSFNKTTPEAEWWEKDIRAASDDRFRFIPFNHGLFLSPSLYMDAYQLDYLYQARHPDLLKMYRALEDALNTAHAEAMVVFNCPPYHPDFLRKINVYKVLFSSDDPDSTYRRNIPYLHAYHHVFYVDPAYSPDMDMQAKMRYCGMRNADLVPNGTKAYDYDPTKTEATILENPRPIDILYVGSCFPQKLAVLAEVRKAFGRRFRMHGFFTFRNNIKFNLKHRYFGWVLPISFEGRRRLLQSAKIGFNLHWNDYGLGNERLYYLPANGVMQICDCNAHLGTLFEPGDEIVGFSTAGDLIEKIRFYLEHESERKRIALNGYRRVMRDYRFPLVLRKAGDLIVAGIQRLGWVQ